MNNHKLTVEEMKQIAHFIAQRNLSSVGSGEIKRSVNTYLETYERVMEMLESENVTK